MYGTSASRGTSSYCTDLFTTTPSPHPEQMNASMADNPGNVSSAPQWVQRALQISRDAISRMTAEARSEGTVRTTAPHSLQIMSV
jgi:hypothetical protein